MDCLSLLCIEADINLLRSVDFDGVIKHFALAVNEKDFLNCVLHCNCKCMQTTHWTDICVKQFLGDRLYKCSAVAEINDRLAAIDISRKLGTMPLLGGELGPHVTQCGLGRGLPS